MLLAIDIGNTNIVFGVYETNEWTRIWRIQTDPLKTADEYEVIFRSLFTSNKVCKNHIEKAVVSSVVPKLNREFDEMLSRFIDCRAHFISPEIYDRLPLKILNPYEIGSDLVANSMAAHSRFKSDCMVIDFGTALTFTTISANGEILGVAIAPGLRTAIHALAGNTAQLPDVQPVLPPSVLGTNTVHAIQAGIVMGYTGLVDRIITKTEEELNRKLAIVSTGGLAQIFAHQLTKIEHIDSNLTLEGLRLIGELI
ncbi:type III pantothenate kinase [Mangrovibacterium diazotrophicum]|uniref:Type III pantothenate kinase n=1 Tax=Mangrovibacterium diazotrophicum TaxID=1261403 RepID=A0A419W9D3_9BACT|nr:type III pantothenate kinase [Mangrovibacterium diazotrophicum]RKD92012.1 pantothenate kinase [Mangrovibacterium diazotrophicum]